MQRKRACSTAKTWWRVTNSCLASLVSSWLNRSLSDQTNVLQLNPGYVVKFNSRSTNSFAMVSLKVDLLVVRIELGGEMPDLDVLLCFLLLCWFSCFCLVCGSPSVFFVVWELLSGLFVESYASAS
ncbi:hypothetical protein Q3G72_002019 [Acer saccharum]|nr:hypothetical protein Q3G72_002019 [Acer saccharum]